MSKTPDWITREIMASCKGIADEDPEGQIGDVVNPETLRLERALNPFRKRAALALGRLLENGADRDPV